MEVPFPVISVLDASSANCEIVISTSLNSEDEREEFRELSTEKDACHLGTGSELPEDPHGCEPGLPLVEVSELPEDPHGCEPGPPLVELRV